MQVFKIWLLLHSNSCVFVFSLQIMVFFSSCNSVKFHSELLNYIDIPCLDIHGKQKQQKRTSTYFEFCNAEKGILLCTDVAARGLDIPAVVCFLTNLYQQNANVSTEIMEIFIYTCFWKNVFASQSVLLLDIRIFGAMFRYHFRILIPYWWFCFGFRIGLYSMIPQMTQGYVSSSHKKLLPILELYGKTVTKHAYFSQCTL